MDWQTIIQQQETLEKSFMALKQIFEQAEQNLKTKNKALLEAMSKEQAQDALALSQIQKALGQILSTTNNVKQN